LCCVYLFDPRDENKLRKTNIEGTTNIVNFPAKRSKNFVILALSTAALGDVISTETIITEKEWNPESNIVTMPLNTVPK
jgi:hypothetical protein